MLVKVENIKNDQPKRENNGKGKKVQGKLFGGFVAVAEKDGEIKTAKKNGDVA